MQTDPTADRRCFGLIGEVVAGNPTEEMMEAAFHAAGLSWKYVSMPIPPDRFDDAFESTRTLGFAGLHITKPYKIRAAAVVDELSTAAAAIGAVNCVVRRQQRLIGDNTDGRGLVAAVSALADLTGRSVVVLGAGGAARAVAVEIALAGAGAMTIVSRDDAAGRSLVEAVTAATATPCRQQNWAGRFVVPDDTDLVVNATSVGMIDPTEPVEVDLGRLRAGAIAADVVIAPTTTAFLGTASAHGLDTVAGVEMLVEQAAISFELWAGIDADRGVLRRALSNALGG